MDQSERPRGSGPEPGGPDEAADALRSLEQRLDRATEAAQRLAREAAESATRAVRRPPPSGWETPTGERSAGGELDALVGVIEAVRDLVPDELRQRLFDALRELLLAVRALIDWYLERFEQRRRNAAHTEVEDIPIS